MQKCLFFWELAGWLFVSGIGSLLHFVFDWSGGSAVAAVIASVNESTWEHMKLLFFPMAIFSAVQFVFLGRHFPNFLAVRALSTLCGITLIPVLFYTYTGILGYDLNWANIAVFVLSALGAFAVDRRLLRRGKFSSLWQQIVGLLVLWALAFVFVWYTFRPIRLALWRDPVTGQFGIL